MKEKNPEPLTWNELRLFPLSGKFPTATVTLLSPVDTSTKS